MSFVIEGAIKGIAAGIGLASESIHAHIAKKAGKPQRAVGGEDAQLHSPSTNNLSSSSEGPSSESSTEPQPDLVPEANDEQIWELDAAQEELEVPNYDTISPSALEQYSSPDFPAKENEAENQSTPEKEKHTIFMSTLIANFLTRNPPPHSTCTTLLSLPILLPQRRPKSRSRSFIHAYPPILDTCSISQTAWFDFLTTFNTATQASPWLQTINLASFALHGVAPGVAIAIQIAIAVAVKAASEMHSRQRTNSFLDKMNNEFFRPRGLYALVLTWRREIQV